MGAGEGQDEPRAEVGATPTPATEQRLPVWMSVQAAANELEVTTRTIYRFINDGKLTAYRIGRVYRIRRSDLDDFLGAAAIQPGDLDHLVDDGRPRPRAT